MPQQPTASVQNNFTGGLKTEFTGLNFPANAATDADNVIFTLLGDVIRREGFDYELNNVLSTIDRTENTVTTYKWNNAGGDGSTQVLVVQIGTNLYFFKSSAATVASPLSAQKMVATVNLNSFAIGTINGIECQFADGNGFLFVFHPGSHSFYCTLSGSSITATQYSILQRDFQIVPDGFTFATRPNTLGIEHNYNLFNQGWGTNDIDTFFGATGTFPALADQWWSFKDADGHFNPTTTVGDVNLPNSPAPRGYFLQDILNFNRNVSGIPIDSYGAAVNVKTGAWFAGRVWAAGLDFAQTNAYGTYVWSENIYFSQIITDSSQFGNCYQQNDPTDENLFALLPSDGGVIKIQGCGSIYKLFALQNGLLVFAANGVWFITGNTGIGFTADDYTITKISAIESISHSSFVDVQGFPMFWNEEGIYMVSIAQGGTNTLGTSRENLGITVDPITVGTILTLYSEIPVSSKKHAKGYYSPIDYIIQWIYKKTPETDTTSRYEYDGVLNYNTINKAFYTYTIEGTPKINAINYIQSPGGTAAPDPTFKYLTSVKSGSTYQFTFSEERNEDLVDWEVFDGIGTDYDSFFVTGYNLAGKAITKFQPTYVYVYTRNPTLYNIQGIWDYATSGNTGRFSTLQQGSNTLANHNTLFRRHKIRGHGKVLQLQFTSVSGQPFDIIGWAIPETVNMGS